MIPNFLILPVKLSREDLIRNSYMSDLYLVRVEDFGWCDGLNYNLAGDYLKEPIVAIKTFFCIGRAKHIDAAIAIGQCCLRYIMPGIRWLTMHSGKINKDEFNNWQDELGKGGLK